VKYFVLLIFLIGLSYACSGDCMQCHPVLKKSIEEDHHKILKSCITCHTKTPTSMTQCGGDCFSCHSKQKLIKSNRFEHREIASCKKCHISEEDFLNSVKDSSSLIDILNQK